MSAVTFTTDQVIKGISNCSNTKAFGPDKPSIFHLKNLGPRAIEYLTALFNDSVTYIAPIAQLVSALDFNFVETVVLRRIYIYIYIYIYISSTLIVPTTPAACGGTGSSVRI